MFVKKKKQHFTFSVLFFHNRWKFSKRNFCFRKEKNKTEAITAVSNGIIEYDFFFLSKKSKLQEKNCCLLSFYFIGANNFFFFVVSKFADNKSVIGGNSKKDLLMFNSNSYVGNSSNNKSRILCITVDQKKPTTIKQRKRKICYGVINNWPYDYQCFEDEYTVWKNSFFFLDTTIYNYL